MSTQGSWQKVLQEKRLQHQLEIQSRQIESVLNQHDRSAHVKGGYVAPRSIRFDVASHLGQGLEKLRQIKQELLLVLGVPDAELIERSGIWQLHVARAEEPPVSLFDLLPMVEDALEPMRVILGLAENGRPVLVQFDPHELPHMLVAGKAGAGKSSLLRSIALGLALTHKQSQLQLLIMDGNHKNGVNPELEPLSLLPHMQAHVLYGQEECADLIKFLASECDYRREDGWSTPNIVLCIDEVLPLLAQEALRDGIVKLLQRGPEAGIHLVLSTEHPTSERLSSSLRFNLPVRLVGQTMDEAQSAAATGLAGTQAEYLLGKGDFLAVLGEQQFHFQAAFVGDYDLHLSLETLQRNRPRPLVAQPLPPQQLTPIAISTAQTAVGQPFTLAANGVKLVRPSGEQQ